MRKMIAMMIVLVMGLSLYANNNANDKSRDLSRPSVATHHPEFRAPNGRTEEWEIWMTDDYGDGWNGGYIDLYVNGALVEAGITVDVDDNSFLFDVDDFDYISVDYTPGSWSYENEYSIYDAEGNMIVGIIGQDESGGAVEPWDITHTVDFSGDNVQANGGFEGEFDAWEGYPHMNSMGILVTGETMFNSDETFTAFAGEHSGKMWGLYEGGTNMENNLFHTYYGEFEAGTNITVSAHLYTHNADPIGQGNNSVVLFAKYFSDGWGWIGMDASDAFDGSAADYAVDTWTARSVVCTVPEGAAIVQIGVMLTQPSNDDHGAVVIDNFSATVGGSDDDCDYNDLTIYMNDSYGDGWNGNVLTIGDLTFGLESGLADTAAACLEDGSYAVTCDGGSWQSEVSWQIVDAEGTVLLEGGAPYSGVLSLGETSDVPGCTDPTALNYDPAATVDDGSCYYAGDSCSLAIEYTGDFDGLDPVTGATTYAGDVEWYSFVLDQAYDNLNVSLIGSDFDTKLDVYSDCATMIGTNDDYDGLQSQVNLFDVAAGTYHCMVYGYGSAFGNFVLTVAAFQTPNNPTDLSALGGLERVYLSWLPAMPSTGNAAAAFGGTADEHIQWQYDNKKEPVNTITSARGVTRAMLYERLENDGSQNNRDTEVIVTLYDSYGDGHYGGDSDGDAYILSDAGDTLHTLEGPWTGTSNAYGPFTFADGVYAVAWDPTAPWLAEQTMEVTLASDTTVVLGAGAAPVACFALGEGYACGSPDLTVTNVSYDDWSGRAYVTVANIGSLDAGYFYTMAYISEPDTTELYPPGYFQYYWEGVGLAAGDTMEYYLSTYLTLPDFVGGYDDETYTIYAMADGYGNYVIEDNEGNNVGSTTVVNSNPLANSSWNVYRSDGGGDPALAFNVTAPDWGPGLAIEAVDEPLTADVEYCYTVTQVDGESETAASNQACATPSAPPDVPAPTDLTGSAVGFDVSLAWTAPEPFTGAVLLGGTPSSTRQGGDTIDDATVITELPFSGEGTTAGYTDDYDEVCPYTGATAPDVVYSITPETDMAVNMWTCYSAYDTKLYVYENTVGNLAPTTDGGVACNDDAVEYPFEDCTIWTSRIDGVSMSAGNTYYVVVDGYAGSNGDYVLDIDVYNPLAGFQILMDGAPAGIAAGDATSWDGLVFAAQPIDASYEVRAMYLIPGIFDPVYSETAGPVVVTIAMEDSPRDLEAMDYGDDVHLMWTEPIDASSFELAYDDGVVANAYWYGGAVAVRFRVSGTYGVNGLANSVWTGGWPDAFLGETPFTLSVLALDTETDMPGDTLFAQEVLVDADPTSETYGWAMIEMEETLVVTGDVFVMYSDFGFDFDAGAPGPDMDMMTCDAVLDHPAMRYEYIGAPGGGEWATSAPGTFAACGDWMLRMHADFTVGADGAAVGNWVGPLGMVDPNVPVAFGEMEAASTKDFPIELFNPQITDPVWSNETNTRDMTAYNIYRDGAMVDDQDPDWTEYWDEGLEWGTYSYYVTAQYDDHESIPTNEVEVTLSNVPPDAVMLISPGDGLEISVDSTNLGEEVAFIWTAANDADNDPVEYLLSAEGVIGEDSVFAQVPFNRVVNESFEDGTIDGWSPYPEGNASWAVDIEGTNIYGSDATLEVYDGQYALKQWGQYDGTNDNYGSFGQWFNIGDLGLVVGGEAKLGGAMMSHADDWVGQGGNAGYLIFYFYDDAYNMTGQGWEMSAWVDADAAASEWHELEVSTIIPENTTLVWAGVEFYQPTGDDHGSVYTDAVWMYTPLYTTGVFVPYGVLASAALEGGVPEMTWTWDVWAFDGFEATSSSSGPRDIHVDVSDMLGIDGENLPTEFALHNNYPNPFNPITNILYDIPEVSDVTLEIYNVMGQRVRTLVDGSHEPGRYQITWNATNDFGQGLSSGMYIYRIQAGDFVSVKKLVLMK